MNGKFAFVDMTPRDDRLWEIEAHQLKTQLVDEFLAWSAGSLKKLPTQKPKNHGYGLYAIRLQTIDAPKAIPGKSAPAVDKIYQLNDVVDLPAQKPDQLADTPVAKETDGAQPEKTTPTATINLSSAQRMPDQNMQDQNLKVNYLDIDNDEFKIAVHVPRLGMDRMLDSTMLHVKLNDFLERGLIPHDAARAAFRSAQQSHKER